MTAETFPLPARLYHQYERERRLAIRHATRASAFGAQLDGFLADLVAGYGPRDASAWHSVALARVAADRASERASERAKQCLRLQRDAVNRMVRIANDREAPHELDRWLRGV